MGNRTGGTDKEKAPTRSNVFKPVKRKKNKDSDFDIPHNFKIGQKIKITAEHRSQYLCFKNPDGTLNNPTFEIISFQKSGGLIIMNLKEPNMKCLVSYIHLVPKEKENKK